MEMDAFLSGVEPLEESLDELKNDWALDQEIVWVVGTPVEYAIDVEYGTDPHTIRADEAEALHFKVDGEEVFVQEVDHPGTTGQPFMRPAAEVVRARMKRIANEAESYPDFMKKAAQYVERLASKFAPVRNGDLRASIEARQEE